MTVPDLKSLGQDFVLSFAMKLGCDLGLGRRDLNALRERTICEGVEFLTRTLPLLGKALERGISSRSFQLPNNFKKKFRGSEIPAFCGALFQRVFRRDGALLDEFCTVAVYQIRQLCYMANKVDLPCKPALADAVVQNFVLVEKEVEAFNRQALRPEDELLLSACNSITRSLFSDFDFDTIRPKSGPGVTSNVEFTAKQEYKLHAGVRLGSSQGHHFWFNETDAFERLERYPTWSHKDYFDANLKARVILVPKDSRGPRLISCEPQENQFLQQGIMEFMVNRLETSPLTRGQINFTDQSVNQRMARLGSMTREWATLDLKDASDRISLKLVTKVFGGSPIFSALLETRTPITVLPDGTNIPLSKFAPMGSALCFPVLATIVYAISVTALIKAGLDPDAAFKSVFVYGDDIIVPSDNADLVARTLETFCLRVNRDKSFINSYFTESCGYDAVKGNDVTPIRLRQCLIAEDPHSISSVVATANQLTKAGLRKAAEFLYSKAERFIGKLPYGTARAPYLSRIWTGPQDQIPEANACERGIKWKKETDLNRYPLGRSLRALSVVPVSQTAEESMFGRLSRVWPQIGVYDAKIAAIGEFPRPRCVVLKPRTFDHYSME